MEWRSKAPTSFFVGTYVYAGGSYVRGVVSKGGLDPQHLEQQKTSVFSTGEQSRFAPIGLDSVLGLPRLAQHTYRCPCISVVPDAKQRASRGPLMGAASAQKALQGSKTETRELLGGTEEKKCFPNEGSMICPPGK